eukprot:Gb_40591 [translate_table: standard]
MGQLVYGVFQKYSDAHVLVSHSVKYSDCRSGQCIAILDPLRATKIAKRSKEMLAWVSCVALDTSENWLNRLFGARTWEQLWFTIFAVFHFVAGPSRGGALAYCCDLEKLDQIRAKGPAKWEFSSVGH